MISHKGLSENLLGISSIVIGILVVALYSGTAITDSNKAVAQKQIGNSKDIIKVAAGGGNSTNPMTAFSPQKVEIKTGQSVSWYNPTQVAEPHTVTFVLDKNYMTGLVSPVGVSTKTKFAILPPGSNNQPLLSHNNNNNEMNTIIAVNARSYNPVAIDASGNVKFMNANSNYTMAGTEKYLNSGWFLPKGQEHEYPGSGNIFTVTFQKPGTYNYLCILHPWMTGTVIVK